MRSSTKRTSSRSTTATTTVSALQRLTQKLDCLQGLGVTCLWLLPFFPSPLKDDGYDVADYRNVHPSYGSLSAFTNSSGSIGSILVTGETSMAKRPSARSKVIDPAPPPVQPKPKRARAPAARSPEPSADDVRRRAYERYLERGGRHGQHFDDWLEAEKELKARFKTRSRRGEARFALGPTEAGPYDQPVLKRALRSKK